jgi:hypothetical protein
VTTVSERVALKKSRLSKDGQVILNILVSEYGMTEEAATRLMRDGGTAFAVAMLSRRSR